MLELNGSGGLCMTCNNAPTCFYRATRGPALFCELFDDYVPQARELGGADPTSPARSAVALQAPAQEDAKYTGLCVNCEHRTTCAHPRPTGGVWHCEDYA